jgi:hypothetical protein
MKIKEYLKNIKAWLSLIDDQVEESMSRSIRVNGCGLDGSLVDNYELVKFIFLN